ncbi:MAG: SnoaL-like domain-containing protein [Leptospiraceae bacterium]|nr:SnoaL-like domain-containing protein [Leptospiraceae bacterium]
MNTKEIASKLVQLCKEKKFSVARKQLFSNNAVGIEADGSICKGLKTMDKKEKGWHSSMEKFHSVKVSKPLVNGNFFSVAFTWDVTYKGKERTQWSEIGIFEIKNGKIIMERFFY